MHRTGERLATVLEHPGRVETAERPAGSAPSLGEQTLLTEWPSAPFREALDRLRRFAPCRDPLLLTGETGAGKTAFAEIAHRCGPDPDAKFVVVNAAALPDGLLQAELFGHERGAFTGADRTRAGLLRRAGRGTVFLDEIDKASRALQASLLHVLDRGEVRPVGSDRAERVEARIVVATNRPAAELTRAEHFLPDLAYRLNSLHVTVPPLRKRAQDLPRLLELALEPPFRGLTDEAHALIAAYSWPGNVRELFGVIRAATRLEDAGVERIGAAALCAAAPGRGLESAGARLRDATTLAERVERFERDEILLALRVEQGCQRRAAERLGLSRRGLNKKLHRLGLLNTLAAEDLPRFRSRPAGPGARSLLG